MSRRRLIWIFTAVISVGIVAFFLAQRRVILYDAMQTACWKNDFERVQLLIRLGADPDGTSDYRAGQWGMDVGFSSHVMAAVQHPDCRILKYLLSKGARPDIHEGGGNTPLSTAINEHNVEAVKVLLAAGADPNYPEYDGRWTAADQAQKLGFSDLVEIITPYLKQMNAPN